MQAEVTANVERKSVAADAKPDSAGPALVIPEDGLVIVPVRNMVLFPGMIVPISVGRDGSIAAAQQAVTDAQTVLDTAIANAAKTQQAAVDAAADLAAAQADAATADAAVQSALNAAANKRPVDDATKAALDALLAGKIAVPLPL